MDIKEQYNSLDKAIKSIFDLTSRIDERVKILIEHENEGNNRMEKVIEKMNDLTSRTTILESKDLSSVEEKIETMQKDYDKAFLTMKDDNKTLELRITSLEIHTDQTLGRWKFVTDAVFKVFITALSIFMAWKLGVK